jgi:hypothetical protein
MALTLETGAGVQDAESYASITTIDAYWTKRPHDPLAASWAAELVASKKEGAAREATAFLDGVWGAFYRGQRAGYVQGLLCPRTEAKDDAGYPLPDLWPELVTAVCELAPRALAARLMPDVDLASRVKSEAKGIGPLSKRVEYFDSAAPDVRKRYGFVETLLAPVLVGSQPGAPSPQWTWS